jgi:dTMP kinase
VLTKFITFEGGEGTGKSTQIRVLAEQLRVQGHTVTATREPGGTDEAEAIRTLLVNGSTERWSAEAEALLNYAARDSHIRQVIKPALQRGEFVLCDRFMDSTRAYQHYAGGCSAELIDILERSVVTSMQPTLTIILDLEPAIGLARAKSRGEDAGDRFERKGKDFHDRLRKGFLEIARLHPKRCVVFDASKSVHEIAQQVEQTVLTAFNV